MGIADVTHLPVDIKSLARILVSATQTKRSRYERWTNVEGIFKVIDSETIIGKHVLIVDDVITTGSTIESCTNELLKVEGVKVSVVALAFAVV
jgi:predicted amidophosphoribosyltransferase